MARNYNHETEKRYHDPDPGRQGKPRTRTQAVTHSWTTQPAKRRTQSGANERTKKLFGIVTDRDLTLKIVAEGLDANGIYSLLLENGEQARKLTIPLVLR